MRQRGRVAPRSVSRATADVIGEHHRDRVDHAQLLRFPALPGHWLVGHDGSEEITFASGVAQQFAHGLGRKWIGFITWNLPSGPAALASLVAVASDDESVAIRLSPSTSFVGRVWVF